MRKTLAAGIVVFICLLVVFAPAKLLRSALESSGTATLLGIRGTLWSGQGELLVQRHSIGLISWELQPLTLARGVLSYHLDLRGPDQEVTGLLQLTPSTAEAELSGTIRAAAVNRWLEPYNIQLQGLFTLEAAQLQLEDGIPVSSDGTVLWTGGPVSYQLAGEISSGILPEMTAYLGPSAEATVFPSGGQTPLLQIALQPNGFAKVGVTKLLTRMLGTPWPGSEPDHAVVLEVEEQVF